MRSTLTGTRECEMQHLFKATGRCDEVASHRVVTDHGEERLACQTWIDYFLHQRGKCLRCRKPLVWCWKVQRLGVARVDR